MSTHSRHAWGSQDVFFYILSTRTRLNNPIGDNWAKMLMGLTRRMHLFIVQSIKYKEYCIHIYGFESILMVLNSEIKMQNNKPV